MSLFDQCCLEGCFAQNKPEHSHIIGVTRYKYCCVQHQVQALKGRPLVAGAYRETERVEEPV